MIVSLIREKHLYMLSLPEKVSGKYWVTDQDAQGHARRVADIEGLQGKWTLHGSKALTLAATGEGTGTTTLTDGIQVVKARCTQEQEDVEFYIEPSSADRQQFQKYMVPKACKLNIGRVGGNQIVYENPYVSAHHACLIWKDGRWSLTDTQSGNGTFVNGERVVMRELRPGDMIWIMGLEIVVGNGFFALNNPDGKVRMTMEQISPLPPQKPKEREAEDASPSDDQFSPAPVLHRQIERETVRVDAPPNPQKPDETPLPLLLGPALTMGMTAIVMASVALNNYYNGTATLAGTIPTIIMSFSMLCGTLLWPLLTKRHEKKKKKQLEELRQRRYGAYLDTVRGRIFSIGSKQSEILFENYPDCGQCAARAIDRSPGLWERSQGQKDFLTLRLGLGTIPIDVDLHFPEDRFAIEDDTLQNEVQRLAQEPKVIQNVPVVCSLDEHTVLGVAGSAEETDGFLRGLILQMAALHTAKELKLIFINDSPVTADWARLRLLPHTWDDTRQVHYWACDADDGKALSAALEKMLLDGAEEGVGSAGKNHGPNYVFVVSSLELAGQIPAVQRLLSGTDNGRFSCVIRAADIAQLPRDCSAVVKLEGGRATLFDKKAVTAPQQDFTPEDVSQADMDRAIDSLANLALDAHGEQYALPNMLTFLEMYGVGKVEHLNALTRWRDNNPVNTLQTPIGVDESGNIFYLDLHEKYHGPHGLVAGMTGSGKSEFIITFILSMAVNFHPDEVSFILIDYKGGGLAGAFENQLTGMKLPHLAGTITNLDGAAVNRALISIQSELRRRQAVFNEARKVSGEGTIDIYKYQKMYRNGLVKEPVPHLFIISDEFAELKAQQPEFMAQLISTARIGRSLGVHLILATQKPSGVVDDQIWSNSRFRVCLKVQERSDSMEMLKRPDAAELSDTGRFYLQVGFNELFELGQSAWCGAPYVSADKVARKRDDSVELLDDLGRVLSEAKPKAVKGPASGKSQIVSIVEYLSSLAQGESIEARQLWLPPIPATIYLNDLVEKYGWKADPLVLEPIVGEYDDPFNQAKGLLTLSLSRTGNALLYGATGSGKSILLDTLLCGLIQTYDASRLNVYLVDLGEETLRAYERAPQVGGVMLSSDGEKIQNLFKLLSEEIEHRKKKFSEAGGTYTEYCTDTGEAIPHILVLIRNYAAFSEQFEDLDDQLVRMSRDCFKYGVYFLLTANSTNAVRYRIAQSFPNILCLQMNDRSDYAGLFGRTEGVYPSAIKGRGIFKSDRVYEFQSAAFAPDASLQAVRALSKSLREATSLRARQVPHLPERVTVDEFPDRPTPANIPVGVERSSLKIAAMDLERPVFALVTGQDMAELGAVAQGIAEQLERLEKGSVTVLDGADAFKEPEEVTYSYISSSFAERVELLFQEMVRRNNTYKAALQEGKAATDFEPEYYVITGLASILEGLDTDGKDKLNTLMAKAETAYHIRFVLCETDRALRQMNSEGWYKKHITGGEGVWVGDGLADQYAFKLGRLSSAFYSEAPPCFGYVIHKGKPVLTKLLVSTLTEGGEENE